MLLQTTLDSLRKLPIIHFKTDSRKITPGDIFVCAQGLNYDSHHFIEDAVNRGAVGLIAQRQVDSPLPCFIMSGQTMTTSLISQYYNTNSTF